MVSACLRIISLHLLNFLTIPVYDNNKSIINICFFDLDSSSIHSLNSRASLISILENNNVLVDRILIDFDSLINNPNQKEYLQKLFNDSKESINNANDIVKEIDNGFIFSFPHITYRIIGNFFENAMSLKVNIKAIKNNEVFINSIDLYKNRERQNFIFNLMEKFNFRDHIQLENDFTKIIEVIENHKQKNENNNKSDKQVYVLTNDEEKKTLDILTGSDIIKDHLLPDTEKIGLVGEEMNKKICYHAIISRLWRIPVNVCTISMYGLGKTFLHDTMHRFIPDEDLKDYSRITKNDLYYHEGENAFVGKVLSIDEVEGLADSLYSIRTLISKGYLSISYPAMDPVTRKIRSEENKVFGRTKYICYWYK